MEPRGARRRGCRRAAAARMRRPPREDFWSPLRVVQAGPLPTPASLEFRRSGWETGLPPRAKNEVIGRGHLESLADHALPLPHVAGVRTAEAGRIAAGDAVAARFSAAGTVLDPENIMLPVSTATSERFEPSVGFGGGVFLVVWEERISSTLSPDVRGVRVGRDGRPVGAVFFVSRSSCGDCNKPRVAFDGTNFAVVWQRGISSSGQVAGARISTAGVLIDTTPKYLAQARNNSTLGTNAAITYANGRYILAWLDQTSIFAARLMPDLTRLDTTGIEIAQGANSDGAAIAAGGDQVWIGWSATGSTEQLVRRIGRDDAVPIGNAVSVAPVTSDPY